MINTSLICNEDETINTIKVLARIRIKGIEIETLALLDPGCTSCLINKKIVPTDILQRLPTLVATMQMDGTYNLYEFYIENASMSFHNTFYKPSYPVNRILVRDLDINADFVIGLNFIFQDNGGCILTRYGVVFFKQTTHTPVQIEEMITRGRINNTKIEEPCCKSCTNKKKCSIKHSEKYQEEENEEYNSDERNYRKKLYSNKYRR